MSLLLAGVAVGAVLGAAIEGEQWQSSAPRSAGKTAQLSQRTVGRPPRVTPSATHMPTGKTPASLATKR